MKIKIQRLCPEARLPAKATDGSACYDLAITIGNMPPTNKSVCIWGTGLSIEVPKGYVMKIYPRSSLFNKYGLWLANQTGIIDSDYRGEIKLITRYQDRCPYLQPGTRIAQFEIVRQGIKCEWSEEGTLTETERGDGGFGSTGI